MMNSQKHVFLSFVLVCILVSLARAEDQASKPQTKEEEPKENGANQHVAYSEETDQDDINKRGGETYEEDRQQIVDHDHDGYFGSDDWGWYYGRGDDKYGHGPVRSSLYWGGGRGGGGGGWGYGGGRGGRGYGGGHGGRGGGGWGYGGGRGGRGGGGWGHGGGRGGGGWGYGGGRGGRGGVGNGGMSP